MRAENLQVVLEQETGLDLEDFRGHYAFIELDAEMQGWESVAEDHFRANLVRWEVWEDTLKVALEKVPGEGPGTLVFGSALNLLLFSPTYGGELLEHMKTTLREGRGQGRKEGRNTPAQLCSKRRRRFGPKKSPGSTSRRVA